jgi:DNA ligase (NAD+)
MKIKSLIEKINNNENLNDLLNEFDKENILKLIEYFNDKYYNKGKSLITDKKYDDILEYYERKYEKINKIGAKVNTKEEIKLPYFMPSLNKVKTDKEINKWTNKYNGKNYVISCKIDGESALLIKENNIVNLYTRGDGEYGKNISHVLPYINVNHNNLKNGDTVRGELNITRENFKKINENGNFTNSRNYVIGTINKKEIDKERLKYIDFIPYALLSDNLIKSKQFEYIKNIGVEIYNVQVEEINNDILSELYEKMRNNYKYEIDGLVISDNSIVYPKNMENVNPKNEIAFKGFSINQISEKTKVIDIIWEITKTKRLFPTIRVEEVEILNSKIEYITGNNYRYICDNEIGIGSIVIIEMANLIIPKIHKVIKTSKNFNLPKINYEFDKNEINLIAIDIDDETNDKIKVKKMEYFFKTLDIKYLGEMTIKKFVDNNYDDIFKIISAKKEDINKFLGNKITDKIYNEFDDKLINRELYEIMDASCLFVGIADKKFKLLLDVYPNFIDMYKKHNKEELYNLIKKIKGFEQITINKILNNMDEFIIWYDRLIKIKPTLIKINDKNEIKEIQLFDNRYIQFNKMTLCFSGFRDKNIEQELIKNNIKVSEKMNKDVNILIIKDIKKGGNKYLYAIKNNIKIIEMSKFYEMLM